MGEMKKGYRTFAQGVSVSNDTHETGMNNHDLIIGGSGSGKTGTYVKELLMAPYGSLIVSDTKRLLHRIFKNYLEEQGYKVYVLDFVEPEKSIGYNPLSYIRRNEFGDPNEADIMKLATAIMPKLDATDPFWEKAAIRYIAILIGYVIETTDKDDCTMKAVCEAHRMLQKESGRRRFEAWASGKPGAFAARKYQQMKHAVEAERMWSSIMEFVNQALDVFDYREYDSIWEGENMIDIENIGREKTVLFINSSDNDTSTHALSYVFNTQAMQVLLAEADKNANGRLDVPCRLVLDDFAAAAKIEGFDNLISILRSRDISVSIIVQSLSQLKNMYSQASADTIINNCAHVLYLAGKDRETMQYVADYLNQTIHTVLKLPKDKAVFIEEGSQARVVTKLIPYANMPKENRKAGISK